MYRLDKKGVARKQISTQAGVSESTVSRRIIAYKWEAGEIPFTRKELYDLYWKQNKTIREIADIYFCSPMTVYRALIKFKIRVRKKGNPYFRPCYIGTNSGFYKK